MKTIKIIFADDDLKYSMLLKRFLEAEGYEVTYFCIKVLQIYIFTLISFPGHDKLVHTRSNKQRS